MSVELLYEAQQSAFRALADILNNPAEHSLEYQQLRGNVALAVVNMVPAGVFDTYPEQPAEAPEGPLYGEVIDFPEISEVEAAAEQAALEAVTTEPRSVPMDPHGAPPLGGAS